MVDRVIDSRELPLDGSAREFQGHRYDGVGVSFFLIDAPPGGNTRLHAHPYETVALVREGKATFTIGESTVEASEGHIVVVPAGVSHRFVNSEDVPLRQVDIHHSGRMETEWLED